MSLPECLRNTPRRAGIQSWVNGAASQVTSDACLNGTFAEVIDLEALYLPEYGLVLGRMIQTNDIRVSEKPVAVHTLNHGNVQIQPVIDELP